MAAVLKALVDALNALVAALGQSPVFGGGPGGKGPVLPHDGHGAAQAAMRRP
jgi:hypothetical protein